MIVLIFVFYAVNEMLLVGSLAKKKTQLLVPFVNMPAKSQQPMLYEEQPLIKTVNQTTILFFYHQFLSCVAYF